jgi:hypothetical protein
MPLSSAGYHTPPNPISPAVTVRRKIRDAGTLSIQLRDVLLEAASASTDSVEAEKLSRLSRAVEIFAGHLAVIARSAKCN